jgi:hypothetical protein
MGRVPETPHTKVLFQRMAPFTSFVLVKFTSSPREICVVSYQFGSMSRDPFTGEHLLM